MIERLDYMINVRLKPLFWFTSDTETQHQIGRYILSAYTITDTKTTFQRENLFTESVMFSPWNSLNVKKSQFQKT